MKNEFRDDRWVFAWIALGAVAFATPSNAAPSKCDAAKLTALGKKAAQDFICQAKAAGKGELLAPSCRLEAGAKLAKSFERADEKGDCSLGDSVMLGGLLDRYTAQLDQLLRPVLDPNKCAKKKLVAAGKDAIGQFACQSQAARKDLGLEADCVLKAGGKVSDAFAKAESKPPCLTAGDSGATDMLLREAAACFRAASGAGCLSIAVYTPSLSAGTIAGYLPLDAFGVTPIPIGDENVINFTVPPFIYNGRTWNQILVDPNGYIVVGGGDAADNNCCNIALPSTARPNNILAPFWTDLDGTGAPGIYLTTLTDGVNEWLVVEWRVNVFGTTSQRKFQVWIGLNGLQDVAFAYDPLALPGNPNGQDLFVGAESVDGSRGTTLGADVLPTQDLRVTSTPLL
jgi:hypothetical protein